jgi:undecaprenyl-diphosphatase
MFYNVENLAVFSVKSGGFKRKKEHPMIVMEAVILGVIQGLTEFLPVSSSAHLTLVPQMLNWHSPLLNSLAFDVALHAGTLLALLAFFWKDILRIIRAFVDGLAKGQPFQKTDSKLAWLIIVATLPAVAAGLAVGKQAETLLRHPVVVAGWLIVFGLIMALAEWVSKRTRSLTGMNFWQGLTIGTAQALALLPGVSRSGSTITAGLFLGFKREDAARFAFLLSLPAVLGAIVFEGKKLLHLASADQSLMSMAVGAAAAAVTGYFCIQFLLAFLQRRTLYIFTIYRLILGGIVLWWAWSHAQY